ncbi:MAG: FtsQ-type POTRA domain-containing protein [Vampirovibrionales bacterium]|nr:FtsQ-type POTRA domain-containing protein [Vampirovibrionales bacterium]
MLPSFRRTGQATPVLDRLRPLKTALQDGGSQRPASSPFSSKKVKKTKPVFEPALAAIVPKDQLQERRKQKQWLMQVRRMRLSIRLLFSLCLIAAVVAVVGWLWQPVQGSIQWATPPRLVSQALLEKVLTQQSLGTSVWLVNPHELEAALVKQSPLIASAAVRRHGFPPRLMVSVVEHTPWAAWYEMEGVGPSNSMKVKKPIPKKAQTTVVRPVLNGLVLPSYQWVPVSSSQPSVVQYIQHPSYPLMPVIGLAHQKPSAEQWQALQLLTETLTALSELHVQALDVRQPGNVRVICEGPDIYVGPLNGTWQQRFQRISGVLPHLAQWASLIEAVDLRWEQQVTLHKKTKARLLTVVPEKNTSQFQRP